IRTTTDLQNRSIPQLRAGNNKFAPAVLGNPQPPTFCFVIYERVRFAGPILRRHDQKHTPKPANNPDEEWSFIMVKFGSMNHLAQSRQSPRLVDCGAFLESGLNDFPFTLFEK